MVGCSARNDAQSLTFDLGAELAQLRLLSTGLVTDKHVVFVHGLRFSRQQVWFSLGNPPELWPLWLEADIEKLGVWSVEHDSAPTLWRGYSMHFVDRANNVLALLLSEERLQQGDISFVVHSFGGLIFEQLLRTASDRASTEPHVADFVRRIGRVIFLGTPHRGADLATWASLLRLVFWPSPATRGLGRNDPNLRGLNQWYRRYAVENSVTTLSLVERRRSQFGIAVLVGMVVPPDSADPGLACEPIPIDADHFGLASPESRDSEIYKNILTFLKSAVPPGKLTATVTLATLNAIERNTSESAAALEQIAQQLTAIAPSESAPHAVPRYLVNGETEKRILRLRKIRFLAGSDHVDEASRLARELLEGELAAASPAIKATALAWCARMLFARTDRTEALRIVDAARRFARTEQVSITEAFANSYDGKPAEALNSLAALHTPSSRAASFIIVANSRTAVDFSTG